MHSVFLQRHLLPRTPKSFRGFERNSEISIYDKSEASFGEIFHESIKNQLVRSPANKISCGKSSSSASIPAMSSPDKSTDQEGGIHFNPPLYRQRYSYTVDVIERDPTLRSLLDIGCGTCQLLTVGKYRNHHLQLAAAVDIVRSELDEACFRLKPLPVEYVVFRRQTPLHMYLLHADATNVCPCFRHFDVVTLIEVIEHLYLKDLEELVKHVFGHIQPRLVIVTTPNADFNVLFATMICGQFRHADHKFEFTRAEFQSWAQNIVQTYGYRVEFDGLGDVPRHEAHRNLGFCTQIALFHRVESNLDMSLTSEDFSERLSRCNQHELIGLIDYPFGIAKPVELREQVRYILEMYRLLANDTVRFDGADEETSPLTIFCQTLLDHPRLIESQLTLEQLKVIVESMGYQIVDKDRILLPESPSTDSHDEIDDEDLPSPSNNPIGPEAVEECWD